MKDGANVVDVGAPLFESLRSLVCAPENSRLIAETDPFDCVRLCPNDEAMPGVDDGEEKMADLGRRLMLVAGEAEGVLAKGLLRRCAVPLALKDIANGLHEQFVVSKPRKQFTQLHVVHLRK
jgi:hypothetical protein